MNVENESRDMDTLRDGIENAMREKMEISEQIGEDINESELE